MKRYNEVFIKKLKELENIMLLKGEIFRSHSYKKAIETLLSIHNKDINNINDLNELKKEKGIGEAILNKLKEYVETGKINALEREKNNPIIIFSKVYGIGPKKSKELSEKYRLKTIQELREASDKDDKLLNDKQKIGLKYYEAIEKRIPRKEINDYKTEFTNILDTITKETSTLETFEIVGSYRRGANDSGDIDVILTNSINDISLFERFINELIKREIIVEVLSKGKVKSLLIMKLQGSEYIPRRVDILYSPPKEYPFALLYFTGSALFNTAMRYIALKNGYTLNEHGICHMSKNKIKGSYVNKDFNNEKDIFDFLNIKYKEPKERIDGTSIIIKNNDENQIQQGGEKQNKQENKKIYSINEELENHIKIFRKEGIIHLEVLNKKELLKLLKEADNSYYNNIPFLNDSEYDIIRDFMKNKYPELKLEKIIGAPVDKKITNKVELPFYMGSMDKIKPDTKELEKFKNKYKDEYVLSAKLDGISALYDTRNGMKKLYTRGNGYIGQDISHMIEYIKLPNIKDIVLRGELIIKKTVFNQYFKDKASNPRNWVGGIVNSKISNEIREKYKYIDFVCYEVIQPIGRPSKQYKYMEKENMNRALNELINEKKLTNEYLSELLIEWRESYEYEIDGIIVSHNKAYKRIKGKNPKYAFAFKMILTQQVVEAKVLDVIWTPSKDGLLKPRIKIEPVLINGVKIEYATGFNASFVKENKIGIGAVILLVRSGDVIPHILEVIKPAEEIKMPDVKYIWNETQIDILLENHDSDLIVREKNITRFFKGLDIVGLSSGNVSRIMKAGFDSIKDIIHMSYSDFLIVEGFKEKMANKIYNQIQEKVSNAPLYTLMSVSNIFGRGFGEKKVKKILDEYPNIFIEESSSKEKIKKLSNIDGFALKTATNFVKNIEKFIVFLDSIGLKYRIKNLENEIKNNKKKREKLENHILYNKNIVMTGFRDKDLIKDIENNGGKMVNSVSKNTFVVLVKDINEDTGKANKARELNIPLMNLEQFRKKYL